MTVDNSETSMRKIKNELIVECGPYCWCCGKTFTPNQLQGHHITPQLQGGPTIKDNISILCPACHMAKHNLIKIGQWKQYWKAMKKIRYNGNIHRESYHEFISEIKKMEY